MVRPPNYHAITNNGPISRNIRQSYFMSLGNGLDQGKSRSKASTRRQPAAINNNRHIVFFIHSDRTRLGVIHKD